MSLTLLHYLRQGYVVMLIYKLFMRGMFVFFLLLNATINSNAESNTPIKSEHVKNFDMEALCDYLAGRLWDAENVIQRALRNNDYDISKSIRVVENNYNKTPRNLYEYQGQSGSIKFLSYANDDSMITILSYKLNKNAQLSKSRFFDKFGIYEGIKSNPLLMGCGLRYLSITFLGNDSTSIEVFFPLD